LKWGGGLGASIDKLNRGNIEEIEEFRHTIALVGITGGGKSSTANTLMCKGGGQKKDAATSLQTKKQELKLSVPGNRNRKFQVSGSLTSVTKAVSFRDYTYRQVPFRVIDTPGLADTNRPASEIEEELRSFTRVAKHGITAFLIVLPCGRITDQDEQTLAKIQEVFGPDMAKHAIVVFTNGLTKTNSIKTLMTRDVLLDEIDQLPSSHFLRKLIHDVGLRVIAVDNKLEPHKSISCQRLNQFVLDVDRQAPSRYDVNNVTQYLDKHTEVCETTGEVKWVSGSHHAEGGVKHTVDCRHSNHANEKGEEVFEVVCDKGSNLPAIFAELMKTVA